MRDINTGGDVHGGIHVNEGPTYVELNPVLWTRVVC